MEFFCYHRDRIGSGALRLELLEEHWSYMDRYASQMVARGPTVSGDTATGSVHILSLSDAASARTFAFEEPGYQAGVYRDVMVRRWQNLLGRTMWDFAGSDEDACYLVLGLGSDPEARFTVAPTTEELIAYGPLLSDDARAWIGTAALVRAVDRSHALGVLDEDDYASVEAHRWRFGGRPQ